MDPREEKALRRRFYGALAAFGAIALFAWAVLRGPWRLAIWIFLAGLAVKTWIAYKQMRNR